MFPADGSPFDFTNTQWAMILAGAALLRLLPLLMLVSGVLKLRRFPDLRAVHHNLIGSAGLVVILALIDTLWFDLIPMELRTTFFWSFLWIFAIAWLLVAWLRSAIKTRLRPRGIEIAVLTCGALLALLLSVPFVPAAPTP